MKTTFLTLVSVISAFGCDGHCWDWTKEPNCYKGWLTGKCRGGNNIKCCQYHDRTFNRDNDEYWTEYTDSKCNQKDGDCKHNTNFCNGQYISGKY